MCVMVRSKKQTDPVDDGCQHPSTHNGGQVVVTTLRDELERG